MRTRSISPPTYLLDTDARTTSVNDNVNMQPPLRHL